MVIDTNVWLDWLVFQDSSTSELEPLSISGALVCLSCAPMRDEWNHLIARASIAPLLRRLGTDIDASIQRLSRRYDELTMALPAAFEPPLNLICTDPDDQMFLNLAVKNKAHVLLSRDRALLKLTRRAQGQYGFLILTPDQFTRKHLNA